MMEYKRLTKRICGAVVIEDEFGNDISTFYKPLGDVIDRLAELEDAIEQGKMIELPVKLTEKCYVIFGRHEKYIKEVCVIMYEIGTVDKWARVIWYEGERKLWEDFHVNELYPTREEAEKKLKELQV
jgi:hypothetical protein